jgi:hypothetical protein
MAHRHRPGALLRLAILAPLQRGLRISCSLHPKRPHAASTGLSYTFVSASRSKTITCRNRRPWCHGCVVCSRAPEATLTLNVTKETSGCLLRLATECSRRFHRTSRVTGSHGARLQTPQPWHRSTAALGCAASERATLSSSAQPRAAVPHFPPRLLPFPVSSISLRVLFRPFPSGRPSPFPLCPLWLIPQKDATCRDAPPPYGG